ncbi:Hypothetical protein Minf_1899 [Methylacidiphilum infernorum V4]|uniref:Uncharacterized protein n=1 Tax=Methylacidiphilum infernorum (isolate V4) TaxID=481448 RepID=B3DY01_METI4|nr:Hypothetical protein Minf_1899 [Methylacidiphilum infernorum V4]
MQIVFCVDFILGFDHGKKGKRKKHLLGIELAFFFLFWLFLRGWSQGIWLEKKKALRDEFLTLSCKKKAMALRNFFRIS